MEFFYRKTNPNIGYSQEKVDDWIRRGRNLIYPSKYEKWDSMLYRTVIKKVENENDIEIAVCIMEMLEMGNSISQAKEFMMLKDLSDESKKLIRNIIYSFHKMGPDFWVQTSEKEITPEGIEMLENKRKEYELLEEQYRNNQNKSI